MNYYYTQLLKKGYLLFLSLFILHASGFSQEKALQVIVIGAHPDDADLCAGGTAAQWASMGHRVKFLSLTNGDAGHQSMGGGALAKRRRAEAKESARRLGIEEYEVLDNHDGELIPSLDVRLQVIRRIRRWNADIVIIPRPNDYHPDHRNCGLVVQDAAYMVIVPNVASDTPPLEKNPVFLYCQDRFQKPNPFEPQIAVNIDPVIEKKYDALDAHESQFYEWLPWTNQAADLVPKDKKERKVWLQQVWKRSVNDATRTSLTKWYGKELANEIENAESFQVCEYGKQPSEGELKMMFPMLGNPNPVIIAEKVDDPVVLDGKLEESIYDSGNGVYLKNSMNSKVNLDQDYISSATVFHDEEYLYIGFRCLDKDIHSSFSKRDEHLWKEEAVEVFIDVDESPNDYFEFEVSPRNVIYDSYIVDPVNIDVAETLKYNMKGIKTAVHVAGTVNKRKDEDQYWTVEIALPLKELVADYHPDKLSSYQWDINFYRINADESEMKYMAWSPTEGSFHQPTKFGKIIFR